MAAALRRGALLLGAIAVAVAVTALAPHPAAAATGDGSPTDPDISYVGRWDTSVSTAYVPNWTGAYLRTGFTGSTVRLRQRDAVNLYASIDGGADVFYAGVRGTVNLTPTPLPAGTHTLRVEYRSGDTVFQGLTLDAGATTVARPPSSKLIEFVGDSITAGYLDSKLAMSAYGWVLGEQLGVRHTQIARAGYCLVAQSGCVGQGSQFFDLASTGTTPWDFGRYQASAVVINLGTNDIGHGVTGATFQYSYTAFLQAVRARYPNAALFAMETFKQRYVAETRAAVAARNAAGDGNVYYIGTEGWLTANVDYVDGDGHPTDAGHVKVANRLAPIIAPKIGVPAPRVPAATGDGSPTDPNISFVGRWDTRSSTGYVPYWAGAYLTTGFTGTTVALKQRNTIDLYASIDGGPDTYHTNVSGTVDLTPTRLAAGNHTLRVSYRVVAGSYHGDAIFQGLSLDAGAHTRPVAVPPKLLEFVGDSITVGTTTSKNALTAYGWLIGERLGARHTQIAQGGACLVATADGCVGLEAQFGRLDPNASTPDWDFGRYQASAVVINLGTNDSGHGVHTPQFQASYTHLLQEVRAAYPAAVVFALETFSKRFAAQTQAAVAARNAAGDPNVVYVNTEGWLSAAQLSDSVHPNDAGHQAIKDRLAPIIAARLGT